MTRDSNSDDGSSSDSQDIYFADGIRKYNSVEAFNKELPRTVELINTPDGDSVYVIGTAHFSLKSQDDVSLVIRNVKPNAVVLELCPLRMHILDYDEQTLLQEAKDLSPEKIKQILKDQGFSHGLFYLSFLRASANITKQLGIAPGGEARRAVAEAKKLRRCKVLLGDRPMNITLRRALYGLSFQKKMQISMALNSFDLDTSPITQDDVETYKNQERETLKKMKETMPTVFHSFVTERDIILAHSLYLAVELAREMQRLKMTMDQISRGDENVMPVNVVGVVGIGHLKGILQNYGKTSSVQIKQLMTLRPPKANFKNAAGPAHLTGIYSLVSKKWWNIFQFFGRK
ncbi:hypothetical protein ACFFRR_008158 [Megaselia abdita]